MEIEICSRGFVLPLHEFKSKQSENYIFRLFYAYLTIFHGRWIVLSFFSLIIMSKVLI